MQVCGGELQGFNRFSLGLEEMRYLCQYWRVDFSLGVQYHLHVKKTLNTQSPPVYFHVVLF